MQSISTIGLDIAKSVFQVHGVDAAGQLALRRQLKRRYVLAFFQKLPPCLGLRVIAPLVPRAAGAGAYGAVDAAGLCEALRQAAEERHHRRQGDLRSATSPNAVVEPIHPKAMPVILTTADEHDVWTRRGTRRRSYSGRCPMPRSRS
jgi:transposase